MSGMQNLRELLAAPHSRFNVVTATEFEARLLAWMRAREAGADTDEPAFELPEVPANLNMGAGPHLSSLPASQFARDEDDGDGDEWSNALSQRGESLAPHTSDSTPKAPKPPPRMRSGRPVPPPRPGRDGGSGPLLSSAAATVPFGEDPLSIGGAYSDPSNIVAEPRSIVVSSDLSEASNSGPLRQPVRTQAPMERLAEDSLAPGEAQLLEIVRSGTAAHLTIFLKHYAFFYQQQGFKPQDFYLRHSLEFPKSSARLQHPITEHSFKEICAKSGLAIDTAKTSNPARIELSDQLHHEREALSLAMQATTVATELRELTQLKRKKNVLKAVESLLASLEIVERFATDNLTREFYKFRQLSWHTLSLLSSVLAVEGATAEQRRRELHYHYMNLQRYRESMEAIQKSYLGYPQVPMLKPAFGLARTVGYGVLAASSLVFSAGFAYCAFFAAVALSMTPVGWIMAGVLLAVCLLLALTCLTGSIYFASKPFHAERTHLRATGISTNLLKRQENVLRKVEAFLDCKPSKWESWVHARKQGAHAFFESFKTRPAVAAVRATEAHDLDNSRDRASSGAGGQARPRTWCQRLAAVFSAPKNKGTDPSFDGLSHETSA